MLTMTHADETRDRLDEVDHRIDEGRVESNRRSDELRAEIKWRLNDTNSRIDDLKWRLNAVNWRIDDAKVETNRRVDDARVEINRRVDDAKIEINRRIDALDGSVAELRGSAAALQTILARGSVGVIVCLVGLIGTLLAKGG